MLLTDWQVIGTAGDTIDGREIEDGWLDEAVESFDLTNYTPVINAEHMRYYGSFGSVYKLKTGSDSRGRKNLQARLKPNFSMCELNKEGQKLFTSMELWPGPDGKWMLTGLALTDNPASFGTSAVKLFSKDGNDDKRYSIPTEIELFENEKTPDAESEIPENKLVSALTKLFGNNFSQYFNKTEPDSQEDDEMKPEQFNELKESMTGAIAEGFASLKQTDTPNTPAETDGGDNGADDTTGAEFSALKEENERLKSQFEALEEKFNAAMGEQQGTQIPPQKGATNSDAGIL